MPLCIIDGDLQLLLLLLARSLYEKAFVTILGGPNWI